MDSKTFFDNFETIANAPGGIARLRELILNLAVRGKLVAQIDSEGVGLDFLSAFPSAAGLSEGMKTIPFEIPKTWAWSGLGGVSINRDSERIPISKPIRETRQGPYDYYGASGIIDSFDEFLFEKPLLLIGEDGANLVNRSTPIAFIARGKYWVNNHAHVIDSTSQEALEYLSIVINQMDLKPFLTGTAQPKLNQAKLNRLQIPVPPLEEQKRIVSKVEELMALCDELEAAQNQRNSIRTAARKSAIDAISTASTAEELSASWKRISGNWLTIADTPESISSLRSLILDLAVRGSLVEQGVIGLSASEVTKSMRQKRQADIQLMKRGARKKDAIQSNQPQLAPSHWKKGLLGEVCLIVMGNSPPGDSYSEVERGVPLINGPVEFSRSPLGMTLRTKFTSKPTYMCKKGDILVCVRGATTGRTNIAGFDACIGRGVALVRGYESQKFINLFMWNIGTVLLAAGKGTTFPSISYDDLANLEIAIPPLDEQERLVAKVESLMDMCHELERSLHIRDELTKKIASAMTAEVAA